MLPPQSYRSEWNLALVLVAVCPQAVYNGPFLNATASAVAEIALQSNATGASISAALARADAELAGVRTSYLAVSVAVVVGAAAIILYLSLAFTKTLARLGEKMHEVGPPAPPPAPTHRAGCRRSAGRADYVGGGGGGGQVSRLDFDTEPIRMPALASRLSEIVTIARSFQGMEINLLSFSKCVPEKCPASFPNAPRRYPT